MLKLGLVIQELGREGILPFSAFFASNKPFGAPLAGLTIQWLVSCSFVIAPPPGDAYLFMISCTSSSALLIPGCFVCIEPMTSVVLLLGHNQPPRRIRASASVHTSVSNMGLEPPLPSAEDRRCPVLLVEHLFGRSSLHAAGAGRQGLRAFALLGESLLRCSILSFFSSSS